MERKNRDEVRAFAPATLSNLGPGFDVLGLAIEGLGDVVVARRSVLSGVTFKVVEGDGGRLPMQVDANTAGIAARATLKKAGVDVGVELELYKGLPLGSGLGSSAASAAAAAYAVNLLIGAPLRKAELVGPCLEAEESVSGRHADNAAPAMLGGLVLVRSVSPLDLVRLPVPEGLCVCVAIPEHEVATRDARAALPAAVPISGMVSNLANLAGLVSACHSGDLDLLARCVCDAVVAPARAHLIPGCESVANAALDAGALGASISGSGPAMFALCHSMDRARAAGAAMVKAFEAAGLRARAQVSPADCPGARQV